MVIKIKFGLNNIQNRAMAARFTIYVILFQILVHACVLQGLKLLGTEIERIPRVGNKEI